MEFSRVADFILVYIAEAHACNEWSIHSARCTFDKQPIEIEQPTTITRRAEIAEAFMRDYGVSESGIRLLVDNPEPVLLSSGQSIQPNSFERIFAPWPLRFYVIMNSKISWISEPSGGMFSIEELRSAILKETGNHAGDDSVYLKC